jgi:hypothetical protein
MTVKKGERWFGRLCRALVGIAIIGACSGRAKDATVAAGDSESHFLAHCVPGSCDGGLECLFGICTELCTDDSSCAPLSPASVCRPLDASGAGSAVCDLECSTAADCASAGTDLACDAGRCRPLANEARSVGFSCSSDESCAAGLRCVSNQCTSACASDSDCSDGASCQSFVDVSRLDTPAQLSCVLPCAGLEAFESGHDECAALGAGGRCFGDRCVETLSGQCGDVGQPGARWACYEDLAADLFRERHATLLEHTLCLPTSSGRYGPYADSGDVDFRRCPDAGCADAGGGCAVNGLVLESTAMPQQIANGRETIVMSAVGELRLREPLRVPFELENPVERCEYSFDARFWGIQFFDTISYLPAYSAQSILDEYRLENVTPPPVLSQQAIERGFAQPVRAAAFGHAGTDRNARAITIEDSEANTTLVSGGSRCEAIRETVGNGLRVTLVESLNETLNEWFVAQDDSLDCTLCGTLGCELACRRR